MTDTRLIWTLFAALVFVLFMDDGAAQRWCDTYGFCEEQLTHAEATGKLYYEIEKL
jgi:hypothetical protein